MAHAATAPGYHGRARKREDKEYREERDKKPKKAERTEDTSAVVVNEPVQRRIYGGFNFGAAFFGWMISVGITAIISSLVMGIGTAIVMGSVKHITPAGISDSAVTVSIVSSVILLITLAIAYYAGGYVAGRMSRFDGAKQGAGLWIIGLIISLVLGSLGGLIASAYSGAILQQLHLPQISLNQGALMTTGLLMFILTLIVTLVAAIVGGKVGVNYHRKIDKAGTV